MVSVESVVRRDPEVMSGTPVFAGTRVPVHNLIDYLEAGDSLDVFLDQFPTVTKEQAIAALELAGTALEAASADAALPDMDTTFRTSMSRGV